MTDIPSRNDMKDAQARKQLAEDDRPYTNLVGVTYGPDGPRNDHLNEREHEYIGVVSTEEVEDGTYWMYQLDRDDLLGHDALVTMSDAEARRHGALPDYAEPEPRSEDEIASELSALHGKFASAASSSGPFLKSRAETLVWALGYRDPSVLNGRYIDVSDYVDVSGGDSE